MNLSRLIERWAAHTPDRVALHFGGEDSSCAELWTRTQRMTRALTGLGVRKGDRVAFLGYNNPEMLVLLFALSRLGAMLVPLNWRLTANEHRAVLADCGPAVLFFDSEFEEHVAGLSVAAKEHDVAFDRLRRRLDDDTGPVHA